MGTTQTRAGDNKAGLDFYGPAALGSASLGPIDPIHHVNQRWEIERMMKANLAGDISKFSP